MCSFYCLLLCIYCCWTAAIALTATAFSVDSHRRHRRHQNQHPTATRGTSRRSDDEGLEIGVVVGRRDAIATGLAAILSTGAAPVVANAYTPDADALRESLYLICRVQEATCLQERYIRKKSPPIKKMKLTLRLVDRSYRLLDQVNYISKFIPADDIVAAAQLGNEAAESLQDAIDFVYGYAKDGDAMTNEQKDFLSSSLTDTREKLFEFVDYLPDREKLAQARARVEEENKLNVEEFDPDLANDAGIYKPIELPWKDRAKGSTSEQ